MADPVVGYAHTEEMDLIRDTTRRFLEDRLNLAVVRELIVSEEGFDRGLWKEMSDLGWTGLAISERHGGAGLAMVELAVVLEEMGRLLTPGPFFASAVLGTSLIDAIATPEQADRLLPGLAAGETIATAALFESARGWDLEGLETSAQRVGTTFVIDGVKRFVLDPVVSDLILVAARVGDGVGVFALDAATRGVEVKSIDSLDPTRRIGEVMLDGVEVSDDELLGGGPTRKIGDVISVGRAALAAEQVGGAQRCLDMAVGYAKTRHQFGRPIGSYQAIKHRCAEMLMRVEHARSVAYHAVRVVDDESELAIAAPLAGSVASESYVWAAAENLQIHGGIGFTWEHDAHMYLKRAKSTSLMFGDPAYQRRLLARALGL